mgnify:CR=1 FL=1
MGPSACCSSARPMHSPELCPVQGMPPISGRPPTGRGALELWRIRHDVGHADIGELVFGLTAGTRRDRRRRAAGRRNGEHCGPPVPQRSRQRIPRKDQSLSWKVEGRHRHAFCEFAGHVVREVMDAASDLVAILRFPAYASSGSCGRSWHLLAQAYSRRTESIARSSVNLVRSCHFCEAPVKVAVARLDGLWTRDCVDSRQGPREC